MKRRFYVLTHRSGKCRQRHHRFAELTPQCLDEMDRRFDNKSDTKAIYGGTKFDGRLIEKISRSKFLLTPGEIKDYLNNTTGLEIISSEAWKAITPFVKEQVQVISASFCFVGSRQNAGYMVINPFIHCHAVYREPIGGNPCTIDLDRIPENVHIFRLAGRCCGVGTIILVSSQVKEAIDKEDLTGFGWIPTWTKEDFFRRKKAGKTRSSKWQQTGFFIPDFDLSQEYEHDEYVTSVEYVSDRAEEIFSDALEYGKVVPENVCKKVTMFLKKGTLSDYLENPDNFCVVSKRFFDLMPSSAKENVRCLSTRMVYEMTGEPVTDYVLLNPFRRIEGAAAYIDMNCPGLQLDAHCVPADADIFRIAEKGNSEDPGRIVFSRRIRDIFLENRLRGCRWLPTFEF